VLPLFESMYAPCLKRLTSLTVSIQNFVWIWIAMGGNIGKMAISITETAIHGTPPSVEMDGFWNSKELQWKSARGYLQIFGAIATHTSSVCGCVEGFQEGLGRYLGNNATLIINPRATDMKGGLDKWKRIHAPRAGSLLVITIPGLKVASVWSSGDVRSPPLTVHRVCHPS